MMAAHNWQLTSINFGMRITSRYTSTTSTSKFITLENHNITYLSSSLQRDGYAKTNHPILTHVATQYIKSQMPKLFRGEFDTGIYPDEWHWREGISYPNATREMCNSWKSSRCIASIVLSEKLGEFIAQVMKWPSIRIAQDDLIWKPPSCPVGDDKRKTFNRIDTVGFHQDSAYISTQFEPYENNSVTLWIALDDADEYTGCVEYAEGSHEWRPILHQKDKARGKSDSSSEEVDGIASFHSSDENSYRDGLKIAAKHAGISNYCNMIKSSPTKEGYAILHHQDVWHGSGPNLSTTRHRRALVAHYIRGDANFRDGSNSRDSGPFANATYIYGRYKRYGRLDLDESFFPVIWPDRTEWIDTFSKGKLSLV